MRSEKGALHLGPADVPALIRAATPLDPSRMSARAFPPAVRYIAAVGHVLRARRDPRAWIREMGFDFRVDELVIAGPQEELDELARLIGAAVQPSDLPLPLVFAYEDTGLEDNERHYVPNSLVTIPSAEAAVLFNEPESRTLFASHQAAMLRSFAEFFDDWLAGHHLVVTAATWTGRIHGIRYELVLKNERARRSPLEAPRPVARTGLRAIFGRAVAEFDPYRSASLLDAPGLRALFEAQRAEGAQVRTEVALRGVQWMYLLLAADGQRAVGINPEGLMYRLTGSMVLDLRERGVVELASHALAGAPRG
jgi:hypothetical protein